MMFQEVFGAQKKYACMVDFTRACMADDWLRASTGIGLLGIAEQLCLGNVLDMAKFEKQRTGRPYSLIAEQLYKNGIARAHTLGMWPWGAGMYFTRGGVYGGMRVVLDPRMPSLSSFCATLNPGKPLSMMKAVMPCCFASGSVLA